MSTSADAQRRLDLQSDVASDAARQVKDRSRQADRSNAVDDVAEGATLARAPVEEYKWTPPRHFPFVRQIDKTDCGAACVAMLCKAFGHAVSSPFIRQEVSTESSGTNLRSIQRGCAEVGLDVRVLKASKDRLGSLPMPCIIHWEAAHWIVVYEVGERYVRVADPARGLRRLPLSEVQEKWSGYVATARPTPKLAEAPPARVDFQWMWQLVRPLRRRLILAGALAILVAAGELTPPFLTAHVVDGLLRNESTGQVSRFVGVMAVVLVSCLGVSLWQRRILARAAVELDGHALDFLAGRLLRA